MLQTHVRDLMEGPLDERICAKRYKGTSRTTGKPVRDSEKKKTCMVWPHFSPQQPGQDSAAGNLEGGRKRGRQVKRWADNLKEWTRLDSPTLTRLAEDKPAWRSLSYDVSVMSPLRLQVKGLSE